MKKELAIGICFGLAGILCTCLFGYEYFTTYGFLNAYHMKAFAASDTGYLPLLANILWERGKVFVIIAILSLTALKAILPLLLRCLIYFTGGVFFAACVMNMGILGIVFFLVSWLPHGILYLAALALLLLVEPRRFYNRKNPWLLRLAWGMGVAVLVLLGCPSGKMGLLSSMFTNLDYRRMGIAKELLHRVVEEARDYGCGTIQITASDMGVKLYTDFGFVHNGNFMQYKL